MFGSSSYLPLTNYFPSKSPSLGSTTNATLLSSSATTSGSSTPSAYQYDTMVGTTPPRRCMGGSYSHGVPDFLVGAAPSNVLADLESRIDMSSVTCIGKGNIADVICARTTQDGQQVAIKVVDDREVDQLRSEVASLKAVGEHPNIVRFVGLLKGTQPLPNSSKMPPYTCLLLGYVTGATVLSQYIRTGRSSEAFAAKIGKNVSSGLSHMHQRGFVHRDVWSENILVDLSGVAVLCDFGCACRIGTSTQYPLNLPYMPPGTWGGQRASCGDDAWSLALVLAELVTGRLVKDRTGGMKNPIHTTPQAFETMILETIQAAKDLGKLCERVLREETIDMSEIERTLATISAGGSVPSLTSRSLPTAAASLSSSSFPQTLASLSPAPFTATMASSTSTLSVASKLGSSTLGIGQRVEYCAKSNNVWYPGTVTSRTLDGNGWCVYLDIGLQKEITDYEIPTRVR